MADLIGVPAPAGDGDEHDPNPVVELGVFTGMTVVFFSLTGQGVPVREALGLTIALGLGGAQVIRRLRGGDDDRSGR